MRRARKSGASDGATAACNERERMRRVGVFIGMSEHDPDSKRRLVAFQQGLEKLGWSEGRNIHLDVRFALPAHRLHGQLGLIFPAGASNGGLWWQRRRR